jgi:hypothetical protein
MNLRRTILICVIGLLGLGGSAAVLTMRTIGMYNGVCDELTGFPALLMSAGFIEKGECQEGRDDEKGANSNREHFCEAEPCTTSNRKKGKCAKVTINKKLTCFCKAVGPSK